MVLQIQFCAHIYIALHWTFAVPGIAGQTCFYRNGSDIKQPPKDDKVVSKMKEKVT